MEKIKKDEIISAGKAYMTRHEMSQAAFARHCGVSSSYMSNLLNGNGVGVHQNLYITISGLSYSAVIACFNRVLLFEDNLVTILRV